MTKPANPYAQAYKGFCQQTAEHQLHVLNDEGLHRHLRVQAPGTRMWSWDVITWPDHLATAGDIGAGHMFTRESDMIGFFNVSPRSRDYYSDGAPCIDFRYWAEKLCGRGPRDVKAYDSDIFLRLVREHLEEHEDVGTVAEQLHERQIQLLNRIRKARHRGVGPDSTPTVDERLADYWAGKLTSADLFSMDGLTQCEMDKIAGDFDTDPTTGHLVDLDVYCLESTPIQRTSPTVKRDEILEDASWHAQSEHEAHIWLQENEEHVGSDTWEWDLREYDTHFVFACYAIDLTVRLYLEHRKQM